jgi:hypothetical protein
MTDQPLWDLDVNGEPPPLAGEVCEALLVQQFTHAAEVVDPANVVHLKFSGEWHRLYFDHGIVFWRKSAGAPEPWSDTEEQWQNPLLNLGFDAGILGSKLNYYAMTPIPGGSSVEFVFAHGKRVVFKNVADRTNYHVI